jgi:hypothetical protein
MVEQRPYPKNRYKLQCGLCFYHWVCNCSYGVVCVSMIGFVTVLTVWSLFTNPMVETETTP